MPRCIKGTISRKLTFDVKIPGERKRKVPFFGKTSGPAVEKTTLTKERYVNHNVNYIETPNEFMPEVDTNNPTTSSHEKYLPKQAKLPSDSENLEEKLIKISRELYNKQREICCECHEKVDNIIRCCDCGPGVYFCRECWTKCHKHVWYHIPEIWNGNFYEEMVISIRTLKRYDGHICFTKFDELLTVLDYKGFYHAINIQFCKCESQPETLLRLNLWSCSSVAPKLAVSVSLLEWLRVLCLEKDVSFEGFCHALKGRFHRSCTQNVKTSCLSKIVLQEVMESYRHHGNQLFRISGCDHVGENRTIHKSVYPTCTGKEGLKELKRKVQLIYNIKYCKAVGEANARMPYQSITERRIKITGLPDGVSFREPSDYSRKDLEKIIECQKDIQVLRDQKSKPLTEVPPVIVQEGGKVTRLLLMNTALIEPDK